MPKYLILAKWTDQGIKTVKEAPQRIQQAIKGIEALGGKNLGFHVLIGDYDMVWIAEFPNDEAAAAALLASGAMGNVRTTTLKAFTVEEFAQIVKKMP